MLDRGFVLADIPGRVSWRALASWLRHVHRTDRTGRQIGGEQARWSDTEHLLAVLIDNVRVLIWVIQNQYAEKASDRSPPPEPMPRPGDKPPEPVVNPDAMTIDEFERWYRGGN